MEEIKNLFRDITAGLISAVFSNPRSRDGIVKIHVRPVRLRGGLFFQIESFTATQAFHENVEADRAADRLAELAEGFKQLQIRTEDMEYTMLISKKGKVTVRKKQTQEHRKVEDTAEEHNRSKKYILKEGIPVPFLIDLGVMTAEGTVVKKKMDKFRQINRFLEFIEDILPRLDRDREIRILDFGCGKSYLTFAVYYYLKELRGYDIRMTGLDLKKDVIRKCAALAEQYQYDKLHFLEGNIADYNGTDKVDMVITLHACDTATDHALAKAVGWNAKVILSVPCCQHELNRQIENEILSPVMDYGLLKERFAALLTDGLRAKYLESEGYETQILEFIDMEHTPKNIMIRAVKRNRITGKKRSADRNDHREKVRRQIQECEEFFGADPAMGRLLDHGTADDKGSIE